MEADSTTYDSNSKTAINECLPFTVCPRNYKLYKELINDNSEKSLESQIVERLQSFGLLFKTIKCLTGKPECRVVCKTARVIDRVQWVCEVCGTRQPIRTGSFFFKLQCSILQAIQMILAWCEDVDYEVAAQHFGVKFRVANSIYDKLDELVIKEQNKCKLGGENSVVLAEMYPDCLNRLSPDTTDQPHLHRIVMLADTNHIPTRYFLHVIKDDLKKSSNSNCADNQSLKTEVERVISNITVPNSTLVMSNNMPLVDGASSINQLMQYCDVEMQHFLNSRIWRQAVSLCAASRDLCAGAATGACAAAVQRYLAAALYRIRHGDGFYDHILRIIAAEFTEKCNNV